MALNDYSFLQTTIGGGYPQTGGSAISGSYFELIITPINGHTGNPNVIAADDFNIGNAAENPSGSNMWFGGNVDSIVEKVEFVDQTTPYDIFNIVFVRVYIIAGSIMPTSDLIVLIDIDYTAPNLNRGNSIGRPFCINAYTPSSTATCVAGSGANSAYTGIASITSTSDFTTSNVGNTLASNPNCSLGFNEIEHSGIVPEGQPTKILTHVFVADTDYYFADPGVTSQITSNTFNLNFSDAYTVNETVVRNADNQITTHTFEYFYEPPIPSIEDLNGTDAQNLAKFCALNHSLIYSNFTPIAFPAAARGQGQLITAVSLQGQIGVGSPTSFSAGPTPIPVYGSLRRLLVSGSNFAGYDLALKQVTGTTVKTLAFASTHPAQGDPNLFTSTATSTGVTQLNVVNEKGGLPTHSPDGKVYAVDYPKSNRQSSTSHDPYVNPVAYHEYLIEFPAVTAVTYYDIYVLAGVGQESGVSSSVARNNGTSLGFEDAGTGYAITDATCDYNNDPTITHNPNTHIKAGMQVSGTGIPVGATVSSLNGSSSNSFELSASTTGGAVTNGTLTFSNPIRVYQYDNPEIKITPVVGNLAVNANSLATMPSAASKTTLAAGVDLVDNVSTGEDNIGEISFSFAIQAGSSATITRTRNPKPGDFVVATGGNGLIISYANLLTSTPNNENAGNIITVSGDAYVERVSVNDTDIQISVSNLVALV